MKNGGFMKKILALTFASLVLAFTAGAQVLPSKGMKNTTSVVFGAPLDSDAMLYGLTDTFQARFDLGNFTIEGMLNWSFLANYDNDGDVDNFIFGTSNANPLTLHYGTRGNTTYAGDYKSFDSKAAEVEVKSAEFSQTVKNYDNRANVSNTTQDSYYVNFIWHPFKNFDVGVGTKLNWQVGPAPRYGSWLWESDAHVRQGGFSTSYDDRSGSRTMTSSETVGSYRFTVDAPGTADVVGFVPYANKYAKRAFGIRYFYKGDVNFQIGAAIPNGFNTDDPCVNVGIQIEPLDWLSAAFSYEGLFDAGGNLYAGAKFGMKNFILDVYFAADSLGTDRDDDKAYGTGAAIAFIIPNTKISVNPELGVNFFENDNYDFSWYTGGTLSFGISRQLGFDLWASFAAGSKDKRWDDYDATDSWNGGHIFDIRPSLNYAVSKNTTITAFFDFENRKAFDGTSRDCWSSGMFVSYVF